ncbi:hypothetical protein SNE40_023170 [Patella caerulea]|uniref:Uncharacterized protein n=1 Tax=Patella caerulea TaxID=87958 RepID=A0AAN8G2B7_PATCE
MDPAHRNALVMLFQQHQNQLLQVQQALDVRRRVRRRQRRVRAIWVRQWINRRPQLGLYDRLMVELRNEDPRAFKNFMRMPPVELPFFDFGAMILIFTLRNIDRY